MKIQIRINEECALRHQGLAFTDRFTLVSELLQNARRSGASQVDIRYDVSTRVLQVTDDGCGIDDFQKLLSWHESGWPAALCEAEHPYGIGFAKCLYAASRCIVTSRRQGIDFDTAAALKRTPIEVMPADATEEGVGTRVELHGVDLPNLAARLEQLCLGFPIAVQFNGKPLERCFAQDQLATLPSPIGAIHLAGMRDGRFRYGTLAFLQGFCVLNTGITTFGQVNVVHLDSRQFLARLPDRDKLIDEDLQRPRIEAELKSCWRRQLESARDQLLPERFVAQYYPAMRAWGHTDLLNDLDALPRELFEDIVAYPIQDASGNRDHVQVVSIAPTRAEIESRRVTLIDLDWVGESNTAKWMLARTKGYMVCNWVGLHADHWAQAHVRHLDGETVAVQALSERNRSVLEGCWIRPTVILCEAVRIAMGETEALIRDNGVFHDGTLYIPAGESTGDAVRQASSFTDEDGHVQECAMQADCDALARLIRHLRSEDPVQMLDSLLQPLRLGQYPQLHGRSFHLSVGTGYEPGHSLEQVG